MKKLVIGVLIGMLMGVSLGWAANRVVLVKGTGEEIGTTTNPVYITLQ